MTKGGLSTRGGISETNEGTAINSGGQVRLQSGGATSMTNTTTNAKGGTVIAADKGVKTATVKDRNEVLKLGASKRSDTGGTPVAAAPTPAQPAADIAKKPKGYVIAPAPKVAAAKKKEVKPVRTQTRKPAAMKKPPPPAQ